ncbi:aldehyde dehydrogenase [Sphingosinicella rhizophila]|uniref:Aldehyde dehydrogenase n=1 Tax=Sphingosinicella rhizophila TaxID=3050082 RepID=A0ABU3Q6Q8_9SPHN|nr:aldehyde dehydrogenase [Sphingosinicella sp. GR2756]MDT9598774.1 aldehyde dehydrogenase [Sphingosinicella sp. GR2756]
MSGLTTFHNLVGGKQATAAATFESFDPYKGEAWALIPRDGPDQVSQAVEAARSAFRTGEWPALTASARGHLLMRLADLIEEEADALAQIETRDNGKLLAEMSGQLRYIPSWYRYFGGLADKIEGRVLPIDKPGMFAFTRREPVGVVAAIIPWNSPLLLLTWKLAPLLAAGNTVVIKPSEHASASTLAFVRLFERAGFPPGVVNSVTGMPDEAGAPLISHPDVAKIAFTGGEAGGIAVGRTAAEQLKHITLELGGKSANIVLADANLESAANGVVAGIFAASGQTCIAGSRLLVQRRIHDALVERVVALGRTARFGNPALLETQIGPITTLRQRAHILDHLAEARSQGAHAALGGGVPDHPGWFVEPTILTGISNDMRVAREELFGPVLSVIPFDDEDEAYHLANDTPYGLAAGLWTSSMESAFRGVETLQAGMVWVNSYRTVSYMAPFGGYKRSGIGRENGQEAIEAYLQTKMVWIDPAARTANPFVIR